MTGPRLRTQSPEHGGSHHHSVQSLSHVQLFSTPWSAACQASLSITNSWSSLKLMSIKLVMPSNHLILCHPLLLLPSIFLHHDSELVICNFELSDYIGLHFPRLLRDFVLLSLIWRVLLSLLWDREGSNCSFSEAWFCHLVANPLSCCSVCERPCSEFNLCQLTASLCISIAPSSFVHLMRGCST